MLGAVAHGRTAFAAEATQLSSGGARDDRIGLLGLAALEYPKALEYERPALPTDSSANALEADERRRAVAAVHHKVLNLPFPLDIAGEGLRDAGPSEFWQVLALTVRPFVPVLDGESSIHALRHVSLLQVIGNGVKCRAG